MPVVYGPVLSWRFGRSLGIDLIMEVKTCTFNCIYCQLGRTTRCVSGPEELKEYVRESEVEEELRKYIAEEGLSFVDVVTFSGTGEPTLNPQLGPIVRKVKELVGGKPIVILTNSSLLYRRDVREALLNFDVVVAKLDAGDEKAYRIINRPCKGKPPIETIIESIAEFRSEYGGKLMIQSMFLHTNFGFTNCRGEHLARLVEAIAKIDPDIVQIDTPYRPGGEKFVIPASLKELREIGESLGEYFSKNRMWIFGIHDNRRLAASVGMGDYKERVFEIIKRRPCKLQDLASMLGVDIETARKIIGELIEEGKACRVKARTGEIYYTVKT